MAETPPRRQRRLPGGRWSRTAAALALIAAVVVVVVIVTRNNPSSANSGGSSSQHSGATTVRRRNLVLTDTESGTLSYSNPQTVYNHFGGTITWLPQVGQVIKPGQTLFKVDGKSVILMNGSTPAYRNLSPSDSAGADIEELNRNLVALGFNPDGIVVDDVWQAATTAGVDLLQASLGLSETGKLDLGRVVFLPGDQLASTIDATLGDGGGATSGSPASAPVPPSTPQFVGLTSSSTSATTPGSTTTTSSTTTSSTGSLPPQTGSTPTTPTTPTTTAPGSNGSPGSTGSPGSSGSGSPSLSALLALLRSETAQLKAEAQQLRAEAQQLGAGNTGNNGNTGNAGNHGNTGNNGGGGAATAVLETTSTHLVVTVDLPATSQSEAKVGENVSVQMPAGNTVRGRITAVSSVAQSSSSGNGGNGNGGNGSGGSGNGGGSPTVPVTITLEGHHSGAGLDQATVSVSFVQEKRRNVLSVPVTALLATSGGQYVLQEAAAPHHLIPVTTGLFAAGYVAVSGSGIYPGLQVTDSQG